MNQNNYDVIIAGAGSVGTPTAYYMAKAGLKVLVIDQLASSGQGSNKHAIGGLRATHSDPAKIRLCTDSISIVGNWQQTHGDDLEWQENGYSFVAYDEEIEHTLKDLLTLQKSLGLNIDWHDAEGIIRLAPDINPDGLRGGTYSPQDGSASPLKTSFAFWKHAVEAGVTFHFKEKIEGLILQGDRVVGVKTSKANYHAPILIDAAGSWSAELGAMAGLNIPVKPDAHEAGITEAVEHMFGPMIVDIRSRPGSDNFYFYQQQSGKIIFCVTPSPQIWGNLILDTQFYLPHASRRLIEVMPRLANVRVRRTWRATYPMTPDGSPLLGRVNGLEGYILATGMCGQGFMLGPGVGRLLAKLVTNALEPEDEIILEALQLERSYSSKEKLK